MLTETQKAGVRRHMGVPALGIANSFFAYDYFFNQESGLLEMRMNMLAPAEEAFITGVAVGIYRINGIPTQGDVLTFTIGGTPVTYTVTAADIAAASPVGPQGGALMSIATNAAHAIQTALGSSYPAAAQLPVNYQTGTAPNYVPPAFAQIIVQGPSSASFTLAGSVTGTTFLTIAQQGSICPINQTFGNPPNTTQIYGYVPICDYLESSVAQADSNISFDTADVVKFRRDEIPARASLYQYYRQRMADWLGVPLYPLGQPGGAGRGSWAV